MVVLNKKNNSRRNTVEKVKKGIVIVRFIILVASVVGLGVLGHYGLNKAAPQLEENLSDKVLLKLAETGNAWANIETEGRTVKLTGTTATIAGAENAVTTAQDTWGVQRVESDVEIAEASAGSSFLPYKLVVIKTEDAVSIKGAVPTESAKDTLLQIARKNYGADNVTSAIAVTPGAPAGWRSAAGSVVFNIGQFEEATAELSERGLKVSGTTVDSDWGETVTQKIVSALPEGYKTSFNIEQLEIEPAAGPSKTLLTNLFGKEENKLDAMAQMCADLKVAAETDVLFSFDSSLVRAEDKPHLNKLAKLMTDCTRKDMVLHGHTDSTGPDLYNQWLSEQRALSAMRYLMRQGVNKSAMTTVGHSEHKPVASNATVAGRQLNRRVEFELNTQQ